MNLGGKCLLGRGLEERESGGYNQDTLLMCMKLLKISKNIKAKQIAKTFL